MFSSHYALSTGNHKVLLRKVFFGRFAVNIIYCKKGHRWIIRNNEYIHNYISLFSAYDFFAASEEYSRYCNVRGLIFFRIGILIAKFQNY